jgi:hypothetical protein
MPELGGRITVRLTKRVSEELDTLQALTGLSKTDLVNRAISLYELIQCEADARKQLAFYDPETETFQLVHIS